MENLTAMTHTLLGFVTVCLPHYMTVPSAPFHFKLAEEIENPEYSMVEVIGFRGGSKSTFASLGYPMQCALEGRYKFIVLINDTTEQVKANLHNIKYELETNQIIRILYPNVRIGETWSDFNLLLSNGVRIIGRSRGMNIRGIRHRQHRPDLIILDDPENTLQVKTKESRDKTYSWFVSEVVPAANESGSKLVIVGNYLHNDGFMARLSKNRLCRVIRIPFYEEDSEDVPAWPGKYPTQKSIDDQREKVGETAWAREYLLKIVAEEDQVILEEDIQRYPNSVLTTRDDNGELAFSVRDGGVGVDFAISEKQTADFTAMVSGLGVTWNKREHILVKPNPVKRRMNLDVTIDAAVTVNKSMPHGTRFYPEDVGYQRAAIQQFEKRGIFVTPMRPITDKRARLQSVATFIKNGFVLFPEHGCEDLIQSIINFGIEEHDDDVDAFVYMVLGMTNRPVAMPVEKIDLL